MKRVENNSKNCLLTSAMKIMLKCLDLDKSGLMILKKKT